MRPMTLLLAMWVLVVSPSNGFAKRVALVVGVSAYEHTTPLANPINDARDVATALRGAGFEVLEAVDVGKARFDEALRAFAERLADADTALFFYAGHGLQVGLQNYLVPTDAKLANERDLDFEAVKLEFVLRQMELDREGKTNIVMLDSCRDNPLSRNLARTMGTRSTAIGRGLAAVASGLGTFIAYSTQPGNVALDGDGRNSPFTTALLKHMSVAGRSLPQTMIEVRKDVVAATGGRQVPWDHSALTGDFRFVEGGAASAAPAQQIPPAAGPPIAANTNAMGFTIVEGDLAGETLRSFRAPSVVSCLEACQTEPSCLGFRHGRRNPVMGQCDLFSRIDAQTSDKQNNWRAGMRKATAAAAANAVRPELASVTPDGIERGFAVYRGFRIEGEPIDKPATAATRLGCVVICHNTPTCVAATYDAPPVAAMPKCLLFKSVSTVTRATGDQAALLK